MSSEKRGKKRRLEKRQRTAVVVDPNDPDDVMSFLKSIGFEMRVDDHMQFLCRGCIRFHWNDEHNEDISYECGNISCETRMCIPCWKKIGFALCLDCEDQICLPCGTRCKSCLEKK